MQQLVVLDRAAPEHDPLHLRIATAVVVLGLIATGVTVIWRDVAGHSGDLVPQTASHGGPEVASSSGSSASAKSQDSHKSSQASKYHKVKKGETFSSIAESYNTSVAALKRDNPKLAASLRAGDVLVIHK